MNHARVSKSKGMLQFYPWVVGGRLVSELNFSDGRVLLRVLQLFGEGLNWCNPRELVDEIAIPPYSKVGFIGFRFCIRSISGFFCSS